MAGNYPTIPAVYSGRSVTPRNIFKSGTPQYLPSLKTIDGTKSRDTGSDPVSLLRAGLLMGKVTSGGKYATSVIGLMGVALHDTSVVTTVMTLPAAVVTEITRRIGSSGTFNVVGPPTAAGTVAVETVTYSAIASATTLTITATAADFVQGSLITAADGSGTPVQLITNEYGVDVTDEFAASQDQTMRLLRGGDLDTSMIVNYSSMDASVKTWVKAALNGTGFFSFSDDR